PIRQLVDAFNRTGIERRTTCSRVPPSANRIALYQLEDRRELGPFPAVPGRATVAVRNCHSCLVASFAPPAQNEIGRRVLWRTTVRAIHCDPIQGGFGAAGPRAPVES